MSKPGRSKQKQSSRKRKGRAWQIALILMVVGGLASSWFLVSRDPAPLSADASNDSEGVKPEPPPPGLENRMILPARPLPRRPVTLNPASFNDPEVKSAYQAAKDIPEVLEYMPCYCGCFGSSGHRNNLDCFKDNHGLT